MSLMRTLSYVGGSPGEEPWWARIRRVDDGSVLGGGVLLGTDRVLTCEHLISDNFPEELRDEVEFLVEFPLPSGPRPRRGRVLKGTRIPSSEPGSGDLVLLELHEPVAEGRGASLGRPLRGLAVYTYGFPRHVDNGLWVHARLRGRSGKWFQLDGEGTARIQKGFSGAPVAAEDTGHVVGIVVAEYRAVAGVAWMIPADTIVEYLPELARHVPESPSLAGSLDEMRDPGSPGGLRVVVVEKDTPSVADSLTMDPGSADDEDPELLNVAGWTADEASEFVALLLESACGRPVSVIVEGLDDAADPEELVRRALRPLFSGRHRLLIVLREESAALRRTLQHVMFSDRLANLEARLAEVTVETRAVRKKHAYVHQRITPVPDPPPSTADLRLRIAEIKRSGRVTSAELERYEHEVARRRRAITELSAGLDDLLDERARLRGLLKAYHARSGGVLSERCPELAETYREAHELLYGGKCELPAAAAAVERYRSARERCLGEEARR